MMLQLIPLVTKSFDFLVRHDFVPLALVLLVGSTDDHRIGFVDVFPHPWILGSCHVISGM
jgi:hypothetical protein